MVFRASSRALLFGCVIAVGACADSPATQPTAVGDPTLLGEIASTSPSGRPTRGTYGRVTVMMTDSPFQDASAVLVAVSEVSVHRTGGSWEPLALEGGRVTCDLKLLEGPMDVLGEVLLEPGAYTQIRLTVDTATIYFGDAQGPGGADACVATAEVVEPEAPSAEVLVPSGIIRLNRPFTVPEGGEVVILLDFDGDASIRKVGNPNAACELDEGATCVYQMTPVISVVSVEEIEGEVEPEESEDS